MLKWLPKMYDTGFDKLDQILAQQAQILKNQETLVQEFKVQIAQLTDLVRQNGGKKKPGPILFVIAGEDQMADKIIFRVVLPEPSAADVTVRELIVTIDGEAQRLLIDAVCTEPWEFSGPQDAQVCISLTEIDEAGNRSETVSLTQQLTDTVAPPAPGTIGFEIVDEIHDDTIEISDAEVGSDVSTSDTVDDLDAESIDDSDEFSIG